MLNFNSEGKEEWDLLYTETLNLRDGYRQPGLLKMSYGHWTGKYN